MRASFLLAVAFGLAGCSAPLVIPEAPSFQHKVSHQQDWDALASRSASRFADSLGQNSAPVFVAPGPSDMPFAGAFQNFVQANLLKRGIAVDERASNAVVLSFDVQTFKYNSPNRKSLVNYASYWTILGAGASQARKISSPDTAAAVGAAAGPLADIFIAMFDGTQAEVSVTLTARNGTRVVYRDVNTFYVYPQDLPLYWSMMGDFVPPPSAVDSPDAALPIVSSIR